MKRILTFALALFSAGMAFADDTAFQHSFRKFTNGMNATESPIYLPDTQGIMVKNLDLDSTFGALVSRKGSSTCGRYPTGNPVTNLYQYTRDAGTTFLIATDGTSIYETSDCSTWNKLVDGLTYGPYEFATVTNNLWIVGQSTSTMVWDGGANFYRLDGTNNHADAPHANHILYWQSRAWLANTPTNSSALFFSVLVDTSGTQLDPTAAGAFSDLYQLYVNPSDGGEITAIVPYAGYLMIFKNTGIFRLQFQDEYNLALVKALSSIGVVSGQTVQEFNGVLTFLGKDGIMYTFNGQTVQPSALAMQAVTKQATQPQGGFNSKTFSSASDFNTGTMTGSIGTYVDGILEIYPSTYVFARNVFSTTTAEAWGYFPNVSTTVWTSLSSDDVYFTASTGPGRGYGFYVFGNYSKTTGEDSYGGINVYHKTSIYGHMSMCASFPNTTYSPTGHYVDMVLNSTSTTFRYGSFTGEGFRIYRPYNSGTAQITPAKYTAGGVVLDTSHIYYITSNNIGFSSTMTAGGNMYVSYITSPDNGTTWTDVYSFTLDSSYFSQTSGYSGAAISMQSASAIHASGNSVAILNWVVGVENASGTWTSPVIHAENLNDWTLAVLSTHSVYNTSLSSMSIYARWNASQAAISTTPWSTLSAGYITGETGKPFAQIRVDMCDTINSTVYTSTANRNYVSVLQLLWSYGQNTAIQPRSLVYNNKYWLAISTGGVYNDLLLKLSLQPSTNWVEYDLMCNSIGLFNTRPMCGKSRTSNLVLWDTGVTDDGAPINIEYQTGDILENAPYFPKYLQYIYLDYLDGSSSFDFGYSVDQGNTWTDYTQTYGNTGLRKAHRFNLNSDYGNQYRIHVKASVLQPVTIYGLDVLGFVRPTLEE